MMSFRSPNRLGLAAAAFIGLKLVNLTLNLRMFPSLKPVAAQPTDLDGVVLLIPMRNEIDRLPATLSGFLTSGATAITFLDDESTDNSAAAVMAASKDSDVSVRVIPGRPRPTGWAGKTWACAQLAESTQAELLVFCDADVLLAPGALRSVVTEMRSQQAQVFSVFPRQNVHGWSERILIPLINNTLLCYLPFPLLAAPIPAAATANGSILAFTARAYRQLDPFESVKDALVEDVAIARLTRAAGIRLGLALGGGLVRVRMFSSFGEMVSGLGRGISPLAGRHSILLALGWLAHLALYTLPPVLAARLPSWRLVAALGIAERLLVEAKTGSRDWTAALVPGLAPVVALPVVIQALRKTQTWKGRSYQ